MGAFDGILVNSKHSLLNFEIGELDCRVITTVTVEYPCNIWSGNAFVNLIYFVVSGQYLYIIHSRISFTTYSVYQTRSKQYRMTRQNSTHDLGVCGRESLTELNVRIIILDTQT